jgi:hypothetical protein
VAAAAVGLVGVVVVDGGGGGGASRELYLTHTCNLSRPVAIAPRVWAFLGVDHVNTNREKWPTILVR